MGARTAFTAVFLGAGFFSAALTRAAGFLDVVFIGGVFLTCFLPASDLLAVGFLVALSGMALFRVTLFRVTVDLTAVFLVVLFAVAGFVTFRAAGFADFRAAGANFFRPTAAVALCVVRDFALTGAAVRLEGAAALVLARAFAVRRALGFVGGRRVGLLREVDAMGSTLGGCNTLHGPGVTLPILACLPTACVDTGE